jgi:hypothetical protein
MYKFNIRKNDSDTRHAILVLDPDGQSIENLLSNDYYYYTFTLSNKKDKFQHKDARVSIHSDLENKYCITTNLNLIPEFESLVSSLKIKNNFYNKKKISSTFTKLLGKYYTVAVFI